MSTTVRKSSSFIWQGTRRRESIRQPGFSRPTELADNRRHWRNLHREAMLQLGLNADLLDDQHGPYYTVAVNSTTSPYNAAVVDDADIAHPNLNDALPAQPAGFLPVLWQVSGSNVSASVSNIVDGDFTVGGKLTVTGLIDPTGLVLTTQAANPEVSNPANTLWLKTADGRFYQGANKLAYYSEIPAAGLADPGGNGIVVRTALNTTVNRSIAVDSLHSITNGDGVSGDPTISLNDNAISNAKLRQGVARSVIGVTGNATANVADIQGSADGVLRVNNAGDTLAFGSIDLSKNATVGSSILSVANGGTASSTAVAALSALRGISIPLALQAGAAL
jgi:hypothetical protein